MRLEIQAQNIKCGGCAAAITQGLQEDARVQSVEVDVASGLVTVTTEDDISGEVKAKLAELGYPAKA